MNDLLVVLFQGDETLANDPNCALVRLADREGVDPSTCGCRVCGFNTPILFIVFFSFIDVWVVGGRSHLSASRQSSAFKIVAGSGSLEDSLEESQTTFAAFSMGV